MDILINLIVIISQSICISNHHIAPYKYIHFLSIILLLTWKKIKLNKIKQQQQQNTIIVLAENRIKQ